MPYKHKYKYNGKEWQDELGLGVYAMDMRQYDPATARWMVQDPVTHHSQSPYNTFDGNPVFWADPSGGDANSLMGADLNGNVRYQQNGLYIPMSDREYGQYIGNSQMEKDADGDGDDDSKVNNNNSTDFIMTSTDSESAKDLFLLIKSILEHGKSELSLEDSIAGPWPTATGSTAGSWPTATGSTSAPAKKKAKSKNPLPNFKANFGPSIFKFKGLHYGVAEFESSLLKNGAFAPGLIAIYPTGGSTNKYYNTHEPGHVLQCVIVGIPLYISVFALPSLIDSKFEKPAKAKNFYTEKTANQLWYWFTGENNFKDNPVYVK
ncbi:MAG: RHS repeat-associated core domain-containing protein [Flavobacterium sp.]